jgi:hypothetical protein
MSRTDTTAIASPFAPSHLTTVPTDVCVHTASHAAESGNGASSRSAARSPRSEWKSPSQGSKNSTASDTVPPSSLSSSLSLRRHSMIKKKFKTKKKKSQHS